MGEEIIVISRRLRYDRVESRRINLNCGSSGHYKRYFGQSISARSMARNISPVMARARQKLAADQVAV